MNNELRVLGEKLVDRKYEIARNIYKNRLKTEGIYEKDESDTQEALEYRANFIQMFGDILVEQPKTDFAMKRFNQWGRKTGEIACSMDLPMDEALRTTSMFRAAIWDALKLEVKQQQMSVDTVFEMIAILDPLLDEAVYAFSLSYVHFHQETLEESNQAFLELSAPVVPITKGVAVLPLIGSMNTERAKFLMEEVLQKAAHLQLSHLLLDLSGVVTVDTMVADQIFKVINALSLLGVEASLIGIRPEVAQTMITIGINIGEMDVKANLETALKDLQQSSYLFS
ncbi:STAS domain-containing protein [Domibacillus tundrae]|uniref:STAS domain-containing protein n=2 Tax=Domibacillus tundrae TaxID=1587527 RepID=UPI000617C9BF|nr:STAS domain-containing protein [Domibacillus tundrae]